MLNMLSQAWGRVFSNIGVRLLRIPLLLTALGPEDYGLWLVLASLSSWLAIPYTGIASVAGGSMAMSVAGDDIPSARRVYSDLVVLKSGTFLLLATLAGVCTAILPLHEWLGIPVGRSGESMAALLILCLGVLTGGVAEVFGARLRASGQSHIPAIWQGATAWIELGLLMLALRFTSRFDILAAAALASSISYMAALFLFSRRSLHEVRFDPSCVTLEGMKSIFRKGLYFQAFPLGQTLLLQGQILVVQWLLGPAAVAVYATARTLVRVISQTLEMVNHSVWPEMSILFGRRDLSGVAVLHRSSVLFSLALSVAASFLFLLMGPELYAFASGNMLSVDRPLLACFLLPISFNALWYTSSMVQLSCNRHEGIAGRFLLSTAAAWVAGVLLTRSTGLMGAALAPAVSDLLMIPFVLRHSLKLTEDGFEGLWGRALRDVYTLSWKTRQ